MLAGKLCEPAAVANSVAATTRGAAVSLEEFPGLDMAAARARLNGNQALLLKLLRRFRHNQANVPADIRAGLAAGDPAKVERLVHTLKGLAATLGAFHLEGKVGVLDSRITAGASPAEMEEALADMQAALEALMAALDAGLPADEASTTQVAAASP
jgi:HPt (histidine-containing phosphotransfer) domain-containing protein